MTIPGGVGTAAVVLLVVFVIGVAVGRSKRRWGLLLAGVLAIAVIGFAVTATSAGAVSTRAQDIARLYSTALPPLVAFLAGWICARASWFTRVVVVAAAVLVLAAFPYPAAGRATAEVLSLPQVY